MAVVPYTFANQAGQIALSELDVNFANVKAFTETAGNIVGNIQSNITAIGTLTSLTVSGNATAALFAGNVVGNVIGNVVGNVIGNVSGNITGNLIVAGANTQVLFNDNGIANAVFGMTFNKSTNGFGVVGNIAGGNLITTGLITSVGNITGADISGNNVNSIGNIVGANIIGGTVSSTGTVIGGNITTAGFVSAAGTVTGGNITASGTVTGGNITTAGTVSVAGAVSVAGTVTGGNITTAGTVSATGNITGGNLITGGTVSLTGNLVASGNSVLSGNAVAPTAANGTSNTQIATTAFVVNSITNSAIPAGVILLWSGSIASIPAGWTLCNGSNSTPDLRDRFIVGAGSTYAVNAVGGSANAMVVDHTHSATSVVSDPSHTHVNGSFTELLATNGTGTVSTTNSTPGEPQVTASANLLANTTGITVSTTIASTGSSGTNANLPPYYALAYIMKL
jgi:hypothetical protein